MEKLKCMFGSDRESLKRSLNRRKILETELEINITSMSLLLQKSCVNI